MPNAFADFFIQLAYDESESGESLTLLKLHKLLYYSYVWQLTLNDKKIFAEEIEAWPYGPELPSQYDRFKKYNRKAIGIHEIVTPAHTLSSSMAEYLTTIWNSYGQYTPEALTRRVRQEKPWRLAYNSDGEKKIIEDRSIKDFYCPDNAKSILPEDVCIRQGDQGFELFVLNQETVDAIETNGSRYEEYPWD